MKQSTNEKGQPITFHIDASRSRRPGFRLCRARSASNIPCQRVQSATAAPEYRPSAEVPAGENWLDESRVESALKEQDQVMSRNGGAHSDYVSGVVSLQQKCDILLKLSDQERMQVLNSRVTNSMPQGEFAISDLPKYFPPQTAPQPIEFVVIILPPIFPYEGGKPNELDLARTIDASLRKGGVKRRVFEIFDGVRAYKLDSALSFTWIRREFARFSRKTA